MCKECSEHRARQIRSGANKAGREHHEDLESVERLGDRLRRTKKI